MASKKKTIKDFLIHIGLIVLSFLFLSYVFFYLYLPHLTKHGESIQVPDLKGKSLDETKQEINSANLKFQIFDSIYNGDYKPHTVVSQFPKAGEKVKEKRNIYITITSLLPPVIKMPLLVDNSLKAAEMTLKSYGLVLGQVHYVPHANQGVVLKQMDGTQTIEAGRQIKKGSVINLLVSSGLGDEEVMVPNLTGLSITDAKSHLQDLGLSLGSIVYEEDSEKEEGFVLKQKPANLNEKAEITVHIGEFIDIWVSGAKP